MKKLARATALVTALALLLSLSGCASVETKMARAIEKLSKVASLRLELDAAFTVAVSAAGKTVELPGSLCGNAALETDPLLAEADLTLSVQGLSRESEYYFEKTEQATNVYSRVNGGAVWQKRAFTGGEGEKVNALRYYIEMVETFAKGESGQAAGVDATRYDGEIPGEFLQELLRLYGVGEKLARDYGMELEEGIFEAAAGVPATVWIADGPTRIVQIDLELTELLGGVSSRLMEKLVADAGLDGLDLKLALTAFSASIRIFDYNKAGDIEIPEEAVNAWGAVKQPWEI